jgi:hypothetical protein
MTEPKFTKWPWQLFTSNEIWGYNEVDRESYIKDWLDHEFNVTVSRNKGEGFFDWKINESLIENAPNMYDLLVQLYQSKNITDKQKKQIKQLLMIINKQ